MTWQAIESKLLSAMAYDAEHSMLYLRFRDSGDVYRYFEFPPEQYTQLLAAESRGEPAVVAERIGLAGLETRIIAAELLQDFLEVMRGVDLQRRRGGPGDRVFLFIVNVVLLPCQSVDAFPLCGVGRVVSF